MLPGVVLTVLARLGVLADAEEALLRRLHRGLHGAQGDALVRLLPGCSSSRRDEGALL